MHRRVLCVSNWLSGDFKDKTCCFIWLCLVPSHFSFRRLNHQLWYQISAQNRPWPKISSSVFGKACSYKFLLYRTRFWATLTLRNINPDSRWFNPGLLRGQKLVSKLGSCLYRRHLESKKLGGKTNTLYIYFECHVPRSLLETFINHLVRLIYRME